MNLGIEDEHTEHKRSTGEMREGMESIASILNKHGHGTLYFGVRNDGNNRVGGGLRELCTRFSDVLWQADDGDNRHHDDNYRNDDC